MEAPQGRSPVSGFPVPRLSSLLSSGSQSQNSGWERGCQTGSSTDLPVQGRVSGIQMYTHTHTHVHTEAHRSMHARWPSSPLTKLPGTSTQTADRGLIPRPMATGFRPTAQGAHLTPLSSLAFSPQPSPPRPHVPTHGTGPLSRGPWSPQDPPGLTAPLLSLVYSLWPALITGTDLEGSALSIVSAS